MFVPLFVEATLIIVLIRIHQPHHIFFNYLAKLFLLFIIQLHLLFPLSFCVLVHLLIFVMDLCHLCLCTVLLIVFYKQVCLLLSMFLCVPLFQNTLDGEVSAVSLNANAKQNRFLFKVWWQNSSTALKLI